MSHSKRSSLLTHMGRIFFFVAFLSLYVVSGVGQSNATLRGTVTLSDSGKPIHNVLVTILQLKRTVDTDENGKYEFQGVPPGRYDVVAHLDRVPDLVHSGDLSG